MVQEHQQDYPSQTAAALAVARQLGLGRETVRRWVVQPRSTAASGRGNVGGARRDQAAESGEPAAPRRRCHPPCRDNFLRRGAVRHVAPWWSRGGERPSPLGRRSGPMKLGAAQSWGDAGRGWQAAPTKAGRAGTTGRCGPVEQGQKVQRE